MLDVQTPAYGLPRLLTNKLGNLSRLSEQSCRRLGLFHSRRIFILHFGEFEVERSHKRSARSFQDDGLVIDSTVGLEFLKKHFGIGAGIVVRGGRLRLLVAIGIRLEWLIGFVVEPVEYLFSVFLVFVHGVQI